MEKVALSKEEKRSFYQSKYDYYRLFNVRMIVVSCLAYFSFFATDCGIFGRFAHETFLSRAILIVPFIAYLILDKKTRDYRIMVPCTYLMVHIIIWCTDWATYLLPDRQHAISGMLIMNLIFMCAGFAAPVQYSIVAHALLIADIFVANIFIQYENLSMMYMFNIPCVVAVCAMHIMMQRVYLEQFLDKNKLEKLAVHDQLTEVHNRNILKRISDAGSKELTIFPGLDVCMMLLDIDYFKMVNDTYGHEAGDKVLIYLAGLIKNNLRVTDYVIRWGGEEFLVIMPGCTEQQAFQIADKIREKVESTDNGVCKTTISIGVALYQGGDYHATIKNADEALYQAKENGRNKTILYQS